MDDLPLLVEHGGWLWIAALAALCIGAGAGLVRWHRWRASYLARTRAEGLDIGGERAVRGTLGGERTGPQHGYSLLDEPRWSRGKPMHLQRHALLWLDTGERRILLDGPIEVVAGSGAGWRRRGEPPAGAELALASTSVGRELAWLAPGDEVVATGEALERAPAAGGGYRDGASEWRLVGTATAPIRMAARAPRGIVAPRAFASIAVIAVGLALSGTVFARACGAGWQRDCAEATAVDTTDLSNLHACSLAAAMPGSRDAALASLLGHLDREPVRDERAVSRLIGLSREIDRCSGTIERLLAHDRYEEAEQEARACLRMGDVRRALVLQGRFADALAIPVFGPDGDPAVAGAALWIAGGSWEQAAAAVSQRRGLLARARGWGKPDSRERSLVYHDCLADLLRIYGGEVAATERLVQRFFGTHGDACTPMVFELLDPERQEALVARGWDPRGSTESGAFSQLTWSYGLTSAPDGDGDNRFLLEPEANAELAVSAWLVDPPETQYDRGLPPGRLSGLARWRGARRLLDGDAQGAAEAARADRAQRGRLPADVTTILEAAIALRAGQGDLNPREHTLQPWMRRLWLRTGKEAPNSAERRDAYASALYAARDGDGDVLARAMSAGAWHDGDVLAVWPRLQRGHAEVRRQLTWSAPRAATVPIWGQLVRSALRRDALARAGLTEEAARWSAIYERHAEVLRDRRRVVALLLADR